MNLTPIRSAWPSAIRGKPLSDRKIVQYAREGRYGTRWEKAFDPPQKSRRAKLKAPVSWRKKILLEYV